MLTLNERESSEANKQMQAMSWQIIPIEREATNNK